MLQIFDEAGLDYVEIDHDMFSNDEVWAKLTKFLLDIAAERRVPRRKGRPPLEGSAALARVALVRRTYATISAKNKRPAYWAEVARKLQLSVSTVWRIRNSPEWSQAESQ